MEALLRKGLAQLGLDDSGAPSLLRYGELLLEKNKVMNLTAITEPQDVATLHFLDSAALLTLADLKGKSVVDVGTGAGLPGMPLKILEPSIRMTLLDSLGKRITFLQEVCDDLGLTDVQCIHARAEEFAADHRQSFDFAVSRAVANLSVLCELCLPLAERRTLPRITARSAPGLSSFAVCCSLPLSSWPFVPAGSIRPRPSLRRIIPWWTKIPTENPPRITSPLLSRARAVDP